MRPTFGLAFAILSALAWLAVSNHCVLASLNGSDPPQSAPSCHAPHNSHAPAKEKNKAKVECCKVLRATLGLTKPFVVCDPSIFAAPPDFVGPISLPVEERPKPLLELDTGPPVSVSFVEIVLQRSLLAHAPPQLA